MHCKSQIQAFLLCKLYDRSITELNNIVTSRCKVSVRKKANIPLVCMKNCNKQQNTASQMLFGKYMSVVMRPIIIYLHDCCK